MSWLLRLPIGRDEFDYCCRSSAIIGESVSILFVNYVTLGSLHDRQAVAMVNGRLSRQTAYS